jgi:hypothetical protein
MKRLTLYRFLAVLLTATIIFASCKKEQSNVRLNPELSTTQVLNVKSDSATVVGFVVATGDGFTEKGVCYDIVTGPTTAKSKVIFDEASTTATFNVKLGGLTYATKYYARAYAINANGTIYGDEITFTTLPVVPTLTTAAITVITGNSATGGGNVTVGGGADITARGVYFGRNRDVSVSGTKKTSDGTGTGAFVSSLTGLEGNTVYYVRAYATNSAGTGYGPAVTFTTLVDLPVVTTTAVTAITKVSAVSGGNVTYDGGGTVTARGLAWGAAANPTIDGSIIDGGTGTGVFVSNLAGLVLNTTYHVRAYATNSAGTAYGADISFTTLADITKLWVVGDYNGWDNSDNAKYIISTATSSGAAEGYVYLTTGSIKLATDHSWDNAHTFGDNGSGGLTNPGGNIPVTVAGYYLIKANLGTMTYSLTLTTWGVIGDATPGGWGSQTDMAYNSTSQIFSLALHLTSGGTFKFRGTSDWNINYGSTAADGTTLNAGGDNIPVTLTADYALTLDLSHPNLYTYSANSWGLIGDFNSWGSDHAMTWDAINHVFTATIDASAAGAFKFRANGAWTVNLGGNLNALTAGGDNIPITAAGNYTITLDPWGLKATVTKN